ncbi:MAG: ZIP family metal transporter [Candidatus Omnitrophica bacterium]|jgi:zinc and cadmium transporter|nr:ZIP family metal transporter [Candidatus Omnitrophota bacterium]
MQAWVYSLVSVIIVSLISLIGVFTLSLKKNFLQKILLFLVSFAVGGLFGDAFIHLLPEAFKELGANLTTSLYIILGIVIFFILEKFIRWHHCHVPASEHQLHPVVALNLLGDGVHNFIDGLIIGATYCVSIPLGVTTTLAVILHEIPQEIGDFGVLVHGGLSIKKALIFNFLSAATSILGAIVALSIGPHAKGFTTALVPITAGGFIYIAGSDLIPELHQGCDVKISSAALQFISLLLGVAMMAALVLLEK